MQVTVETTGTLLVGADAFNAYAYKLESLIPLLYLAEVGLTAGVLRRPDAGLTIGAKYSTNRNEVADLGEIPSLVVNATSS